MSGDWSGCLDALASRLREQRAAFESGRFDEIIAFEPPVVSSPLPPILGPRAQELLREAEELRAALSSVAAAHGRDLRLVSLFAAQPGGRSSFVDTHS